MERRDPDEPQGRPARELVQPAAQPLAVRTAREVQRQAAQNAAAAIEPEEPEVEQMARPVAQQASAEARQPAVMNLETPIEPDPAGQRPLGRLAWSTAAQAVPAGVPTPARGGVCRSRPTALASVRHCLAAAAAARTAPDPDSVAPPAARRPCPRADRVPAGVRMDPVCDHAIVPTIQCA